MYWWLSIRPRSFSHVPGLREQQAFLGLLGDALGDDSPVWVVATVRSEFLSTAPKRAGLAEVIDDPLVIEPLSRARLPIVIQQPAQRAGLPFAPGLAEQLVEGSPAATHSRCWRSRCGAGPTGLGHGTSPLPTTRRPWRGQSAPYSVARAG